MTALPVAEKSERNTGGRWSARAGREAAGRGRPRRCHQICKAKPIFRGLEMRLSIFAVGGYGETLRPVGAEKQSQFGPPLTADRSEARNSKQMGNPNIPKARNATVAADRRFGLGVSVIRACFEFRDSDFELPAARAAPNKANLPRFWAENGGRAENKANLGAGWRPETGGRRREAAGRTTEDGIRTTQYKERDTGHEARVTGDGSCQTKPIGPGRTGTGGFGKGLARGRGGWYAVPFVPKLGR
jgi:hypothetical protein